MRVATRPLDSLPDADKAHTVPRAPPEGSRPGLPRYDLLALAAEAVQDRAYDESAKVRVTQQDIQRLLERRSKERK